MKLIAFYLPQFHQIPENDEWWEPGFTEWTNVKRAKKIFKNQTQPKIPLNKNYYDLMDKNTVEWQTDLMKTYGIYGFCYFHYWFNGRKILEKPAENLIKWNDINQFFCFSWANVTWARTWTAFAKFSTNWVDTDKKSNGNGILIEQSYGERQDWIEHYYYLRNFFKDNRYIKVDNKPMFLIYHVEDIECANEMFSAWNELAIEDGFRGIHIVSMNTIVKDNKYIEAVARYGMYGHYDKKILRNYVESLFKSFHLPFAPKHVLSYEKVWRNILKENPVPNIKTYPGAVVMYDETPRKGKRGTFLEGASPTIFERALREQIKKAEEIYKSDFIFIDAWNEWGEGNYLEPDEEHGYAYLEAVRIALKGDQE